MPLPPFALLCVHVWKSWDEISSKDVDQEPWLSWDEIVTVFLTGLWSCLLSKLSIELEGWHSVRKKVLITVRKAWDFWSFSYNTFQWNRERLDESLCLVLECPILAAAWENPLPLSGKTPRRQTLPPANGTDSTPRLTSAKDNNQDLLFNPEPNLRDYESEHSTSRNVRTDLECAHLNINIPLNNTPVHGILGMGESMYRTGVSPPHHVGDEHPPVGDNT